MIQRETFSVETAMGDFEVESWDNGTYRFTVGADWHGDTASGFGATVGINLTIEDTRKLSEFLMTQLAKQR